MIDPFGIYKKADSFVKSVGTRNALQIASELGIKFNVPCRPENDFFKKIRV